MKRILILGAIVAMLAGCSSGGDGPGETVLGPPAPKSGGNHGGPPGAATNAPSSSG